jgi:uncharacterized protein YndB with AHSA1/START domain
MDASTTSTLEAQAVTFIRYFLAFPGQVFDAWTLRERLQKWWGPYGSELVTCEIDPRPAGSIRLAIRVPDGKVYTSQGTYLEVVRPLRLRFSEVLADAPEKPFVTTVTFEELGAMTRMAVEQTAALGEPLASSQLAGWLASLTRLSELLLPR